MLIQVLRRKFAFIKSRFEARRDYEKRRKTILSILSAGLAAGLVYPPLALTAASLAGLYYFYYIWDEYFAEKRAFYENLLLPLMTGDHYLRIGYELPEDPEKLQSHLNIARMPEKQAIKELQKRAKRALKRPWELVGISKNSMTRHYWVIGATGAGKTSLLMTLFKETMKLGAGLIMVDGKSDAKMFRKLYSLAKDLGREFSVRVINFLKPEIAKFDTNTFQPLATLPPSAQVEFLASIASTGATGDAAYWEGRGKSLLTPVIYTLALRAKHWGEPYSYATVSNALAAQEFSEYSAILVALAKALDDRLGREPKLSKLLRDARKMMTPRSSVKNLELVVSYVIQLPHRAAEIEDAGFNRILIEDLYRAYRTAIETYLSTLAADWPAAVKAVGFQMVEEAEKEGKNVLTLSFEELRALMKKALSAVPSKTAKAFYEPRDKGLDQHNYAQQQWTLLFSQFDRFSHIFGALDPEVDPVDVLRNNKVLYVLLPALEQDKKGAELLGKCVVMAIKSAASVALGGRLEGLTKTQMDIIESRITPIPLGLVVLDEYGAYPVPDIDVLAAQVRSINMSFWLSTQDITSARVGGTDENSLKRVWANTSKVVMKIEDKETRDWLEALVQKVYVAQVSSVMKLDEKEESPEPTFNITEGRLIDPATVNQFDKGMSMWIVNGRPAYVQIFWADQPEIDRLSLVRFKPLYPVKEEVL